MIGLVQRRIEDAHDRVADEFVDRPLVLKDDLAGAVQILVQHLGQAFRRKRFGKRGEAGNVSEDESRFPPRPGDLESARVLHQLFHDRGCDVAPEGALDKLALLAFRSPDQDIRHP